MTTTPPGILTGKPALPGCRIGIPGIAHLNITPAVSANRWTVPDEEPPGDHIVIGAYHDGDLVIGETQAHGPITVHYDTAAQLDALIAQAIVVRDWLKGKS